VRTADQRVEAGPGRSGGLRAGLGRHAGQRRGHFATREFVSYLSL